MGWLQDTEATIDALAAQRRAVIEAGASPSYRVHGREFSWMEYLVYLGEQIDVCRRQLAQGAPFEIIQQVE